MSCLSDLSNYLKVINARPKSKHYTFRVNNFIKSVVYKLEQLHLVDSVCFKNNCISFNPVNLQSMHIIKDRSTLKVKSIPSLRRNILKEDPFRNVLITSPTGKICTFDECITENTGGSLLLGYRRKQ